MEHALNVSGERFSKVSGKVFMDAFRNITVPVFQSLRLRYLEVFRSVIHSKTCSPTEILFLSSPLPQLPLHQHRESSATNLLLEQSSAHIYYTSQSLAVYLREDYKVTFSVSSLREVNTVFCYATFLVTNRFIHASAAEFDAFAIPVVSRLFEKASTAVT